MNIQAVIPFNDLAEVNRSLFKAGGDGDHAIVCDETIFHPQGGGQPSDTGTMSSMMTAFQVAMVRTDALEPGRVLHFGRFDPDSKEIFWEGEEALQAIDVEKRELYSRYHTAGHVLYRYVAQLTVETRSDGPIQSSPTALRHVPDVKTFGRGF